MNNCVLTVVNSSTNRNIIPIKFSDYMAPEYAMAGIFSEMSDIFSIGVSFGVILEIVSGKKNTSFRNHEKHSLLGYVSAQSISMSISNT